jgi:phage terminase large subunit-like protein
MAGSIIDDIMNGKEWVAKQNIRLHYFPAIVEDPVTGKEASCWPERWPLGYLRYKRREDPRFFAKNFENRPVAPNGTYWDDDDIHYRPELVQHIEQRIMVLDPAAKSAKTNDETGIALLGWAGNVQTTVVERVRGVREKPAELRKLVHQIVRNNEIKFVVVDITNGGDWVLEGLSPLPNGAKFVTVNLRASKDDRFTELHYRCQLGKVVFVRPFPEAESQMKAYPKTVHDDRIDVIALGDEYFRQRYLSSAA